MMLYRITKYNPANRNEQGHYLDPSEWTSISDIGKPQYNHLAYETYEQTESAYVAAIQLIMQLNGMNCLEVASLELWETAAQFKQHATMGRLRNMNVDYDTEIKNLRNGSMLCNDAIDKITRLILRETIWMVLRNDWFEARFGHDYYMYIKTKPLSPETISEIEASGLFVECIEEQE